MESETRRIFEELREYLSPLGTWEMKSTCAGPREVMISVPKMRKFAWTSCTDGACLTTLKHQKEREKVVRTDVGPDARGPPWKLKDDSSITSVDSADRNEAIAMLLSAPLTNIPPETPQQPVVQRFTGSAATSGSTSSMPPPPFRASVSGHTSPMKSKEKGKVRKRKRNKDGEAQNSHHFSAESLVQQAWAQAVRVDGTIITLHSGNYELVCLRHRGSQTLYVSDVIEPPTCANLGYGKLHVGIYVAPRHDRSSETAGVWVWQRQSMR